MEQWYFKSMPIDLGLHEMGIIYKEYTIIEFLTALIALTTHSRTDIHPTDITVKGTA